MTTPTLRDATVDDAAAIAEIYNESVAARDATMDLEPWTVEQVAERLKTQPARFATLVLETDAGVVGWASIRAHHDRPGYAPCCETGIYLRRDTAGRGLGHPLIEAQLTRCRELGYHHVVARIFADNERSLRFHKQHGFELVGVQREVGWVGGRWVDIAILQLVFDNDPPANADPPATAPR